MEILSLLAARSTSTRDTPAWAKRFLRSFLSPTSSCNRFAYSFSAYQRLRQVLLKPSRKPVGWTFCPITWTPLWFGVRCGKRSFLVRLFRGRLLLRPRRALLARRRSRRRGGRRPALRARRLARAVALRHRPRDVRGAADDLVGAAHGRRPHALLRRPLVGVGRRDHEVFLVQAPLLVLVRHVHRVGDGRAQRLLHVARHRLLGEAQDRDGIGCLLAADEVQHEPGLLGRGADVLAGRLDLEHVPIPASARLRPRPRGRRRPRPDPRPAPRARPRPWPPSPPCSSAP